MSEKVFWDRFYQKHGENSFEWLLDYSEFSDSTGESPSLGSNKNTRLILDVGCGSSTFGYQLQKSLKFPSLLICADFLHLPLAFLKTKHFVECENNAVVPLVDYVQCDAKRLPFRDDLFDLVIDKGYLDSILKAKVYLDSLENAFKSMASILEKVNERGTLVQITDETPELRLGLLDEFSQSSSNRFLISYTFKEIEITKNNSIFYFYFINKINKNK